MHSKEIVSRAIEFKVPPRLPFWLGSRFEEIQKAIVGIPNDICECYEMDRQKAGWYFDNAAEDDWGCKWASTDKLNMGQVVYHPLENWSKLKTYTPPNPRDNFYFQRLASIIDQAQNRYVVVTSHFNLIERLCMLHGFQSSFEDFYLEPEKCHKLLDIILNFKCELFGELYKQFGDRIDGLFLTDDWGTQGNTYVAPQIFEEFFHRRYKILFDTVHSFGWHVFLHSCGRINNFVPFFIETGVDVLNMQQPQTCGIKEIGEKFAGKICFLATADIQNTLPGKNFESIRNEVDELVVNWAKPEGGFIVFNYGSEESIGTNFESTKIMFERFWRH
ncbi:MAG: hypothetical protein LLF92_03515 [Planctomycetaceae bacterium]|nr:hypothetical protein [Planctomycetaceae bacterium]